MPGESFDAASEPNTRLSDKMEGASGRGQRRFLGVRFDCCRTYSRIYINQSQTAFVWHCPRCGEQIHIIISPDGTDAKFFSAG